MIKKQHVISMLVGLAILTLFSGIQAADSVNPEHRTCDQDSQCSVIGIGCGCCGSGDTSFREDAVNSAYKIEYAHLAKCTSEQLRRCSVTDCAISKKPVGKCVSGTCRAELIPVELN